VPEGPSVATIRCAAHPRPDAGASRIVKRFIAAISLAVFAGAGFAADPPFGRTSSYWENDPLFIAPPP
jgi:hypothetical protein